MTSPPDALPVAVGSRRLRVWALGLALIGLAPVVGAFANNFHDWPAFWSAGATAGSLDLVDSARHLAWQRAHGLPEAFFAYPAGSAWLFAPFAALPLAVGFIVHGLVMLGLAVGAGWLAAPIVGLDRRVAVLGVIAFAPVSASIVVGQNGPLGLLLAVVAIGGLATGRPAVTGVAVGLLLYKPTFAAPLLGLLILRRRWAELAIVALVGGVWYIAGVVAAGGDWLWPGAWLAGLRGYLDADFAGNADKAVSLPGLLVRLGVRDVVPALAGLALVAVGLPRLVRAPLLEAAVGACLLGVAVSPHAWGYDAALVVPFLLWLLAGHGPLGGTARSRILGAAYLLGPLWLVSRQTGVSAVAIVVLGLVVVWLVGPAVVRRAVPWHDAAMDKLNREQRRQAKFGGRRADDKAAWPTSQPNPAFGGGEAPDDAKAGRPDQDETKMTGTGTGGATESPDRMPEHEGTHGSNSAKG